jgi:hypothetical protein
VRACDTGSVCPSGEACRGGRCTRVVHHRPRLRSRRDVQRRRLHPRLRRRHGLPPRRDLRLPRHVRGHPRAAPPSRAAPGRRASPSRSTATCASPPSSRSATRTSSSSSCAPPKGSSIYRATARDPLHFKADPPTPVLVADAPGTRVGAPSAVARGGGEGGEGGSAVDLFVALEGGASIGLATSSDGGRTFTWVGTTLLTPSEPWEKARSRAPRAPSSATAPPSSSTRAARAPVSASRSSRATSLQRVGDRPRDAPLGPRRRHVLALREGARHPVRARRRLGRARLRHRQRHRGRHGRHRGRPRPRAAQRLDWHLRHARSRHLRSLPPRALFTRRQGASSAPSASASRPCAAPPRAPISTSWRQTPRAPPPRASRPPRRNADAVRVNFAPPGPSTAHLAHLAPGVLAIAGPLAARLVGEIVRKQAPFYGVRSSLPRENPRSRARRSGDAGRGAPDAA